MQQIGLNLKQSSHNPLKYHITKSTNDADRVLVSCISHHSSGLTKEEQQKTLLGFMEAIANQLTNKSQPSSETICTAQEKAYATTREILNKTRKRK